MVVYGLLVPLLGPAGGGGGGAELYLVPALLPRSGPAWPLPAGAGAPLHRAVLLFARRGELAAWRRRGYVTAAEAAAEGLLPDGVFAQLLGRVVGECQRVHGAPAASAALEDRLLCAALGRHAFALRAPPGRRGVAELLVTAGSARIVAERVAALAADAVAAAVPGLRAALAVPAGDGGAWGPGSRPYEAEADGDGGLELVFLDGPRGLVARLAAADDAGAAAAAAAGGGAAACGADAGDVVVGRGPRLPAVAARRVYAAWLPPSGLRPWYDVFVSYRLAPPRPPLPSRIRVDFQTRTGPAPP